MSTSTIANAVVSKQECQHTGSGIPSEHRVLECSMLPTVNVFDISVPQAYQLGNDSASLHASNGCLPELTKVHRVQTETLLGSLELG
ncbi:hypothetical protein PQX77_011923 [Marasmius sp. AFHP31]|nr:hypothetical protein PQX77_011923 [Marasmius sp. AFHP31]